MAIMENTIGAIISKFVEKGITAISANSNEKGELVFTGRINGKGEPIVVATVPDFATIKSPRFYIKRIQVAATQTTKPDEADYKQNNPFQKNVKIYSVGIVPNSTFQTEGRIQINVNNVAFMPETDAAAFTDLLDLNIPIPTSKGLELERSKPVEVFAWNPSGNQAFVTVAFLIGE